MSKLSKYSTEELRAEIERRIKGPPKRKSNPDFSKLISYLEEQVNILASDASVHSPDDEIQTSIFELAGKTLYGEDFVNIWNDLHSRYHGD
jgi:hypothetical protein